jgi:hypothetical protein
MPLSPATTAPESRDASAFRLWFQYKTPWAMTDSCRPKRRNARITGIRKMKDLGKGFLFIA